MMTEDAAAPVRASYIGGADIAALIGASPYSSALDVYARKIGAIPEQDETPAMEWGKRLEPVVAQKYADDERVALRKGIWTRGPKPFLGGTPDYEIEGARRGLEVKTAGLVTRGPDLSLWGEDGSDEVPEQYLAQCAWYMEITGYARWDLAAFVGGRGYAQFRVKRDPELGAALMETADRFWTDHVLKRVPPAPDASESAREALGSLWPRNTRPLLRATPEVEQIADECREACAAFDVAEERKREAENRLRAVIADAEGIEGIGWRVTWRHNKPAERLDVEALRATPEGATLCAQFMRPAPGARVLRKNWNTNP